MATRRSVSGILGIAIAVGLLAGACGGPSTQPSAAAASAGAASPEVVSPKPSTPSPTTAPSSPAASEAVTVDLGAEGTTPRGSRVTVHSFGSSERSIDPPAGHEWNEADLEWCLPPTIVNEVTVGNLRYELKLELSDGTTIEPEPDADSPDEVYASDGTFSANDCVRGALVFGVPTGATPEYLLLVGPNGGMRWRLA